MWNRVALDTLRKHGTPQLEEIFSKMPLSCTLYAMYKVLFYRKLNPGDLLGTSLCLEHTREDWDGTGVLKTSFQHTQFSWFFLESETMVKL